MEMSDRYRGAQPLTQLEQVGRICQWWETPSHSGQQGGGQRNSNGGGKEGEEHQWGGGYVLRHAMQPGDALAALLSTLPATPVASA